MLTIDQGETQVYILTCVAITLILVSIGKVLLQLLKKRYGYRYLPDLLSTENNFHDCLALLLLSNTIIFLLGTLMFEILASYGLRYAIAILQFSDNFYAKPVFGPFILMISYGTIALFSDRD